jgi:hypothetical protein
MLDVKKKINTWMNSYLISFKSGGTQWENGDEFKYSLFMFCTTNYILPATS